MKTIISTLALAGLATGLAGGAHAQTFNGYDANNNILFTADLNKSNITINPAYGYNYVVTLDKTYGVPVNVNEFTFNFASNAQVSYVSSPGFNEFETAPGAFAFGAATGTGLTTVGDTATFSFYSPLPPVGSVATASTSPAVAGGGTTTIGPGTCGCPTVPEPASLALLGLGVLPLALVARRRMSAK